MKRNTMKIASLCLIVLLLSALLPPLPREKWN